MFKCASTFFLFVPYFDVFCVPGAASCETLAVTGGYSYTAGVYPEDGSRNGVEAYASTDGSSQLFYSDREAGGDDDRRRRRKRQRQRLLLPEDLFGERREAFMYVVASTVVRGVAIVLLLSRPVVRVIDVCISINSSTGFKSMRNMAFCWQARGIACPFDHLREERFRRTHPMSAPVLATSRAMVQDARGEEAAWSPCSQGAATLAGRVARSATLLWVDRPLRNLIFLYAHSVVSYPCSYAISH